MVNKSSLLNFLFEKWSDSSDTYVYFPANSSLNEGYDVRVFPRATEWVRRTVGAVIAQTRRKTINKRKKWFKFKIYLRK